MTMGDEEFRGREYHGRQPEQSGSIGHPNRASQWSPHRRRLHRPCRDRFRSGRDHRQGRVLPGHHEDRRGDLEPLPFNWSGVTTGTYLVKARAIDNDGATVESAVAEVTLVVPIQTTSISRRPAGQPARSGNTSTTARTRAPHGKSRPSMTAPGPPGPRRLATPTATSSPRSSARRLPTATSRPISAAPSTSPGPPPCSRSC